MSYPILERIDEVGLQGFDDEPLLVSLTTRNPNADRKAMAVRSDLPPDPRPHRLQPGCDLTCPRQLGLSEIENRLLLLAH